MSEILYVASIFLAVAAYIGAAVLLWAAVELAYWIFCKATGREY